MTYSSFYEILNVPENASIEDIKASFRKLALLHHPDKNNNSEESEAVFKVINNAYQVLADPVKRKEYDAYIKTGSIIKSREKKTSPTGNGLQGIISGTYGSLETVSSHINFLLWDIEDFIRDAGMDWNREISGKALWRYMLLILSFIDKWALRPGGFPDYFLEARGVTDTEIIDRFYDFSFQPGRIVHRPFVNIRDYFYNIRKRMDKFLNHLRVSDLVKPVQGCPFRLLDCIFEVQNHTVHYLFYLNRAIRGETEYIPPFPHSDPLYGTAQFKSE
jgi:curved DNA-binding protein CbpA